MVPTRAFSPSASTWRDQLRPPAAFASLMRVVVFPGSQMGDPPPEKKAKESLNFDELKQLTKTEKALLVTEVKSKNEEIAKTLAPLTLFKQPKRANASWVWEFVVMVQDKGDPVLCLVCGKRLKWGGTSNLIKHLKPHETPEIKAKFAVDKSEPNILEKMLCTTYRNELERACLYFVVKTMRPKSLIQHEAFIDVLRVAARNKNLGRPMAPSTLDTKLDKEQTMMHMRVSLCD